MGTIDTIYGIGDDSLAYEFQVAISPISFFTSSEGATLRVTTVEIPETSFGTYTIDYKSETLEKPNGKITTPKEFSIEFRIDKFYNIHKGLVAWNNAVVNPQTGGASLDSVNGVSALRVPIIVTTGMNDLDGNFVPTGKVITFKGAMPKTIGGYTYDNSNAEPITCSVTFTYLSKIEV